MTTLIKKNTLHDSSNIVQTQEYNFETKGSNHGGVKPTKHALYITITGASIIKKISVSLDYSLYTLSRCDSPRT